MKSSEQKEIQALVDSLTEEQLRLLVPQWRSDAKDAHSKAYWGNRRINNLARARRTADRKAGAA